MSRFKNLVTGGVAFKCQVPRAREEREVLEAKDIALVVSDGLPAMRAQLGIRVVAAEAGNFENPDQPEFEDYGRVWLKGVGDAMLTFYTGNSPGFRLHLHGTEGRMEVAKHAGRITLIGNDGARREFSTDPKTPCPWGTQLVDDILHRAEAAMPQAHTFLASELAVRAQLAPVP